MTAVLDYIEINGRLVFDNENSAQLNAKQIFVRRGTIISGSADYPTDPLLTHEIVLRGEYDSNSFAYDPNTDIGNNPLVITGEVSMYGAPKTSWTRLVGDV